jgi:hypothetical protein
MLAPRRTHTRVRHPPSFWKGAGTPPASFEQKLWAHPGTTHALRKLTQAGVNRSRLKSMLWAVAVVKRGGTRVAKAKKQSSRQLRALRVGVRRFPERVREMASQIERLNQKLQSGEVYGGAAQLVTSFLSNLDPSELSLLPNRLHLYATYLESLNRVAAIRKASARRSSLLPLPLELVAEVEGLKGKPYFREVACLLEGTYHAIGCQARVTPKALAMQYSRHLKK